MARWNRSAAVCGSPARMASSPIVIRRSALLPLPAAAPTGAPSWVSELDVATSESQHRDGQDEPNAGEATERHVIIPLGQQPPR